jgi:RHS repeat-associated protein
MKMASSLVRCAVRKRIRAYLLVQCTLLIAHCAYGQSTNGLSLVASGLSGPSGLTFGPSQRLFVSDSITGNVYGIGADGNLGLEASGFASPRDIVFDSESNMYVADAAAGTVYRLDSAGQTRVLANNLLSPCCLGFDRNGNLLVSHLLAEDSGDLIYSGAITRISPTGAQSLVASGFLNPQGVLVDAANNVLLAAEGYAGPDAAIASGSGVYKIDELGQVTRFIDSGSITPSGIAQSGQGPLFFSGTTANEGAVFVTTSGTFTPFATGFTQPHGLALDAEALYVADEARGEVWRVSLTDSNLVTQSSETGDTQTGPSLTGSPDGSAVIASVPPESPWGYYGSPDYSQIPFTPEGVPTCPDGNTCIIGRVLRTDDIPLAGVTVRLGRRAIRTNTTGYWMLTGVPADRQVILFDGRSADAGDIHYPISMLAWDLRANDANQLPFNTYFPILDTAHTTRIDPTRETVHTTPLIPGLEIHIPAGTRITSVDGTPVTTVTTTLVPYNKPLYPMMLVRDYGNHFTLQPGGAVASKPITVIYSNPANFPPGTRVHLWQYAPVDRGGWDQYGLGEVSRDGQQIFPLDGAALTMFGCAAPANAAADPMNRESTGGEPVDLSTGVFFSDTTDLALPGFMPLVLRRTYRNQDVNKHDFGIGTSHSYNVHINGTATGTTNGWIDLIGPDDTGHRFVWQTKDPVHTYLCTNDWRFAGAKIIQFIGPYPSDSGWNFSALMKDGTRYDFDGFRYLRAIRDANGNTITIDRFLPWPFTGPYLMTRVTHPNGRHIKFGYQDNLITRAIDSSGRTNSYVYDASNRLVAFTNALGGISSYTYDGSNNMTSITLPNGVVFLQNMYDSSHRVTNQFQADSGTFSFTYTTNASGKVAQTVLRNPLGNATTYTFNGAGFQTNVVDTLGNITRFIRDGSNAVTRVIDPLSRTNSFVYDTAGNVTAITNAQNKITKFTYEPNFSRLTSVIDPLGRTNSFGYDGHGNLTSITNALGKITRVAYNDVGLPTSVTDPLNNTYIFTHNGTLDLESVRDPLGNKVTRLVDTAGRPYALIDPFNRATRITYDALNRVTGIVEPPTALNNQLNSPSNIVGWWKLDEGGGTTANDSSGNANTGTLTGSPPPGWVEGVTGSGLEFDGDGDDYVSVAHSSSLAALTNRVTLAAWVKTPPTTDGWVVGKWQAGGQDGSYSLAVCLGYACLQMFLNGSYVNLTAATVLPDDGAWHHIAAVYDGSEMRVYLDGRLDGASVATGKIDVVTDPLLIGRNIDGWPFVGSIDDVRVLDRALTDGEIGELYQMGSYGTGRTIFDYDSVGNLLKVTDALGHSVSYGYDAMNQLTNRVDQLGRVELYRYDKNGNVTNFVDRRGISITFKYDALDRRTGVVYAASDSVRLFYDNVGRVTNVVDSTAGSTKLTYDSLDRLMQVVDINGTISYGYNDVGLRTNMTVTGESTVSYRYDNANRLTNVVQGTFTSSLAYDDAGRRTKLVLPNGINLLYSYDTASRLTNITYQGTVTNKIDYAYDEVGNRISQISPLATYLLPAPVSASQYNAANQQLAFGGYTMLYDSNGNVTNILNGGSSQNLLWNSRNQLTNITGSVAGMFKYDGLGRRVERTVSGSTVKFLLDGLDAALEKDAGNAVVARYLRGLAIDEPWQRGDLGFAPEGGPTNSLRGWWKMNEGTGTSVADSSGNGNNGSMPNGGSWASGVASNAVVLDGTNDYIDMGDKATLEGNATWTFAGWINPDQFFSSRDNYLMYKDKVLRWGFLSATSRQPSVDIGSGSGNPGWQGAVTSNTQINSNQWTHLAVTYTNSTVKFYVNGQLTDTTSKTYTMGSNNKAYSLSTATQAFDGKLDDVRYYNRALADSEIAEVYGEQVANSIYMADALGSIVALTDTNKAIQTEYDYEPFGATSTTGAGNKNSYKFTAREDDGTGLYYYRVRYYHPVLGRFVSEDPIQFVSGDVNFYAYVFSAPIDHKDPSGLVIGRAGAMLGNRLTRAGANPEELALAGRLLDGVLGVGGNQIVTDFVHDKRVRNAFGVYGVYGGYQFIVIGFGAASSAPAAAVGAVIVGGYSIGDSLNGLIADNWGGYNDFVDTLAGLYRPWTYGGVSPY